MAATKIHSKEPVGGRRAGFLLPAIQLDRAAPTPLYRQLRAQLASAVRGSGCAGMRLPSTRVLARFLGVSRNTVLTAYEELAAEGLIAGRTGSAMIVVHQPRGAMSHADPMRLLREAQYPARTLAFEDADGTSLFLTY